VQRVIRVYRHVRQELIQTYGRKEFQDMVMQGLLPAMLKAELMNSGFLPAVFETNHELYQCAPDSFSTCAFHVCTRNGCQVTGMPD
jgi:hypothetical protein